MAEEKTCRRCGTRYAPSVIDACPNCGAAFGAADAGDEDPAEDEAPPAPDAPAAAPYAPPGSSPPRHPRGGGGAGPLAWLGTLVLLAIAGAAVWLAFARDDDDSGVDVTGQASSAATQTTTETTPGQTLPTTTTTPPQATGPAGVAALVKLAPVRAQDRGCLARWNAPRNRAFRRKAFAAARGGRRVASVQLVPPGQPTMALHCVVLVGVQPRSARSATPGKIYVEGLPFTSGPSRWLPLGTAFLSYQWNARMRAGGRLAPRP